MEIDLTFLSQIDPSIIKNITITLIIIFSVVFLLVILKIYHSWIWLPNKQLKNLQNVKYILLAIDIPKENEQSPKAVESIFALLWASYTGPNKKEKYIEGKIVPPFSLELVCIDGYIQYLIRAPIHFRDMVEAGIFSQYPDAQITEVNDYVESVDQKYPSDDYELWGTEINLFKPDAYPIRTYPAFEHALTQDFKDPMSSLLEVFSRLGPGEQAWLQFVITAVKPDSWLPNAENVVKKLIGEKVKYKKGFGEIITDPILKFFDWAADVVVIQAEKSAAPTQSDQKNDIMYLTPAQQNQLSAMQMKMSKLAFATSMRYIYVTKKDKYRSGTGINPVFGALNQFNSLELNSFKPNGKTLTSASYFFVKSRLARRQNNLLNRYKNRINQVAFFTKPFILNIEELATVFHFPDMNVKAPLVKKAEAKRSEPPAELPVQISDLEADDEMPQTFSETSPKSNPKEVSVKKELVMDLDNSYFEDKFAKAAPVHNPNPQLKVESELDSVPVEAKPKVIPTKSSDANGAPPPNLPI